MNFPTPGPVATLLLYGPDPVSAGARPDFGEDIQDALQRQPRPPGGPVCPSHPQLRQEGAV